MLWSLIKMENQGKSNSSTRPQTFSNINMIQINVISSSAGRMILGDNAPDQIKEKIIAIKDRLRELF